MEGQAQLLADSADYYARDEEIFRSGRLQGLREAHQVAYQFAFELISRAERFEQKGNEEASINDRNRSIGADISAVRIEGLIANIHP